MDDVDIYKKRQLSRIENSQSLSKLMMVLYRRRYILLIVFCTILGTVIVGTLLKTPVYQADAKILVEKEVDQEKSLLFRMNLRLSYDNYEWQRSEIEIIKSIPLAVKILDRFHLIQESNHDTLKTSFDNALKDFQSKLKVGNIKESNVFEISYQSTDPQLSASIVNAVIDEYVNYRSEIFNESKAYAFFDNQIREAEIRLKSIEEQQTQFKKNHAIISPQAQKDILLSKLADYDQALTGVRTQCIGKEAKLKVIEEQLKDGRQDFIPVTESSDSPSREKFIAKLKEEQLSYTLRREDLLKKYTEVHPDVIHIDNMIERIQEKISSEISEILNSERIEIEALKAEEKVLERAITDLNMELKGFAEKEFELVNLSRGIEDSRDVYSMLLKQREEARLSLAKFERGVKIKKISPALPPRFPVKPNKKMSFVMGALVGLICSLGSAFAVEYFDHSVYSPEDIEDYLKLPVWSSIDRLSTK